MRKRELAQCESAHSFFPKIYTMTYILSAIITRRLNNELRRGSLIKNTMGDEEAQVACLCDVKRA